MQRDEREQTSGWHKSLLLLLTPGAAPPTGGGPAPSFGWGAPFPEPPPRIWHWRSRGGDGLCGRARVRVLRGDHRVSRAVEQVCGRSIVSRSRLLTEHADADGNRTTDVRGLKLDAERLRRLLLLLD